MDQKSKAIPFIVYDKKEGFCLNKEAESYLNNLSEDRKIGVVSIVGKYRTGKSFFVNRVLLDQSSQQKGFQVGPTINPCTKGLWLWKSELKSLDDDQMDILLIDTEGFGGMDENINHDSKIFLFSLLLSSYFIYNSQGSIDENALNSLSLIINLAKEIQVKSKNTDNQTNLDDDPANYFPSFLWVVRDFSLQIVDEMGNKISEKNYLEKALELQKGVSDSIDSKNRIRKLMKHFFKERDCVTLVVPAEEEKDLQNLNSLSKEELRPEFNEQVHVLKKKIFKKVKPKMVAGKCLNGRMLAEICKAYIEAINKGNLPNIENAWVYVRKAESQKAFDKSIDKMNELLWNAEQAALQPDEINSLQDKVKDQMMKIMKGNAFGEQEDYKEYINMIDDSLIKRLEEFKKNNKILWKKKYASLCEQKKNDLEKKLSNEEFTSFWEFQQELQDFKNEFEKAVPKKDSAAEKYFIEISEKLYKLAAEKMSQKQDREQYKLQKQYENMILIIENELKNKKQCFEEEKTQLQEKIDRQQRELIELKTTLHNQKSVIQQLNEDKEEMSKNIERVKQQIKEESMNNLAAAQKRIKELETTIEVTKNESIKRNGNFEKQIALLEQENSFQAREIRSLQEKILLIESENRRQTQEVTQHLSTIDRLKHQVEESAEKTSREMGYFRSEFEKKVLEITSETDRKKDIIQNHSKFIIEKQYLENQVSFYKSQLEENKKIHDALLLALKQNQSKEENDGEISGKYRNLMEALEKQDNRCQVLEEKISSLKKYKNMFKNCCAAQCIHCSKFIQITSFQDHIPECCAFKQNTQQTPKKILPSNNQSITSNPSIQLQELQLDQALLQVTINQTMVRESSDNKPYTEYLIQLIYGHSKWEIARKYKHFCELHQQLINQFPGVRFPESSQAIINSQTDINQLISSKRTTIIEDRRKALQQYIKDLSLIKIVLNCIQFKQFLEIDKNINLQGNKNDQNIRNTHSKTNIDDLRNVISSIIDPTVQQKKLEDNYSNNYSKHNFHRAQSNVLPNYEYKTEEEKKVDKKNSPPSPTSFLKCWTERNLNKENSSRAFASVSGLQEMYELPSEIKSQTGFEFNRFNSPVTADQIQVLSSSQQKLNFKQSQTERQDNNTRNN